MKNMMKFLGIAIIVLVFAFSMTACKEPDTHSHKYGSWTTLTEATCSAKETQERTCSCGKKQTQKVGEPLVHIWEFIEGTGQEPTCLDDGHGDQECTLCGEIKEDVDIDALGHDPQPTINIFQHPTCTEKGFGELACTRCDYKEAGVEIDAKGHLHTTYIFNNNATCLVDGTETAICDRDNCTEPHTRTEVGSAGHNFDWQVKSFGVEIETCQNAGCDETRGDIRLTLELGDTGEAGGIIFHVAPTGFTVQGYSEGTVATEHLNFAEYIAYYLEAAPENEANAQWGANLTLISGVTTFTSSGAAEASMLGNGRKDTYIIATHLNNNTSEIERAAQLCVNKSLNGFTDWFLPSLGELNELYKAKGHTGVPTSGGFWSLSQFNNSFAWYQSFSNGLQTNSTKNTAYSVRAIRAF